MEAEGIKEKWTRGDYCITLEMVVVKTLVFPLSYFCILFLLVSGVHIGFK